MTDREKNLGVRVGDPIIHCNREFTILDIRVDESVDGLRLFINAADKDYANREHMKSVEMGQISGQVTELIKKITEKGLGGVGG
jgi:hypothetical protein